MLCPFCGKERRDLKRCPKCLKSQRQSWRGVTEIGIIPTFCSKDNKSSMVDNNISAEIQKISENSVSTFSGEIVSQKIMSIVNRFKRNTHGENE